MFLYLHKLSVTLGQWEQDNCKHCLCSCSLLLLSPEYLGYGDRSHKRWKHSSKSPLRRFRHDKLKLCLKKRHGEREQDRRILSQYFISSIKLTCVWRAGTKPMDNTGNINLPSESYSAAGRGLSVHIVLCFSARRQAACVQEQHSPPVQANLFPGRGRGGTDQLTEYRWAGKHRVGEM